MKKTAAKNPDPIRAAALRFAHAIRGGFNDLFDLIQEDSRAAKTALEEIRAQLARNNSSRRAAQVAGGKKGAERRWGKR